MLKQNKLNNYTKNNLLRQHTPILQKSATRIKTKTHECLNFSANDYLGVAHCQEVQEAFSDGVQRYGFGSVSSALVSGYYQEQYELEEKFAEFLRRPRALYVGSGYMANIAVLTAMAERNSVIISDKLSHASTLDGITLSRAKHYRFAHNNFLSLKQRLNSVRKHSSLLVAIDGVFGMSGELCDLKPIVTLLQKQQAQLIVDDAHGVGVLGKGGRGISEYYDLSADDITCLVTPLSKAFAGHGAIVSGNDEVIETIIQFAKSYRCTTAPPPAIACALLAALRIVQQQSWRREKLQYLSQFFNAAANDRKLPLLINSVTPIKALAIPSNSAAQYFHTRLLVAGFYTACIRPPSVPEHSTRLRISLTCHHDEQSITQLLDCLEELYATLQA